MKRAVSSALLTAMLACGVCLARTAKAAKDSRILLRQFIAFAMQQAAPAGRGGGGGAFGGPIELGPDDKPAFPDPPAGFNVARDDVPHGELTPIEYDSISLGTGRRMRIYTPPGYSTNRK